MGSEPPGRYSHGSEQVTGAQQFRGGAAVAAHVVDDQPVEEQQAEAADDLRAGLGRPAAGVDGEPNVVVVMYGGLLPHEQALLEAGEGDLVRAVRQRLEQILAPRFTSAVERATGRRVLTFESQILYDPTRTFELFVLDEG